MPKRDIDTAMAKVYDSQDKLDDHDDEHDAMPRLELTDKDRIDNLASDVDLMMKAISVLTMNMEGLQDDKDGIGIAILRISDVQDDIQQLKKTIDMRDGEYHARLKRLEVLTMAHDMEIKLIKRMLRYVAICTLMLMCVSAYLCMR